MKSSPWTKAGLILVFIFVCWVYFSGLSSVPFHPDESTQIFMSADSTRNPLDLSFLPDSLLDGRMRYRLIDSPITHTLLGWGLFLKGRQPILADWDWSLSWVENTAAGALPSDETLMAARWSVAWLFPLSLLFLFLTTRKIDGTVSAVISVLLLAFNALILLHTRRAMAESTLVCTFCAAVWWMVNDRQKIWLSAIPLGLAINAKQTTIPLAGIGLWQVLFHPYAKKKENRLLLACLFVAIIFVITWILNPVYWKSPVAAIQAGIAQRSDLSERMRVDYRTSKNPLEQTAFLIAQVFIQPPAVADVLNYQDDTKLQVQAYFGQPLNNLFRGFAGGSVFFGLTLLGFVILVRRYFSNRDIDRYPLGVFLIIALVCLLVVLLLTPVPFQRYYILLIPLFSIAQSTALRAIGMAIYTVNKKGLPHSGSPVEN
jgi:hypothetical protein